MKLILLLVYLFMTYVNANPCDPNPCDLGKICTPSVDSTTYTCTCDGSTGFVGLQGQDSCGYMRCNDANGDGTIGDAVDCGSNAICENDGVAGYSCICDLSLIHI